MGRRPRVPRSRVPIHRRVLRDPAALRYWLLVAALALGLATALGHTIARAEATRAGWGRTRTVWVLTRTVRPGDPLGPSTRTARWPQALVPSNAIRSLPADALAAGRFDAGTTVTSALVATAGGGPDADERTIAVPLGDAALPVRPGDRVDVWATADRASVPDGTPVTRRVATDARVIARTDDQVILGVAPRQVADAAEAAATATITLVGHG